MNNDHSTKIKELTALCYLAGNSMQWQMCTPKKYAAKICRELKARIQSLSNGLLWRSAGAPFLHANGFRYELHDKSLPGKPDIVLPKYKAIIFVHACIWHGHEGCKYYVVPKTKTEWWLNKNKIALPGVPHLVTLNYI